MSQLNEATALALAILSIVVIVGGFYVKKVWPAQRQRESDRVATRDVLLGRPPILDSITQTEIAPALPGIGRRMETVEQALVSFAQNRHEIDALDERVTKHDEEIAELKAASVERVVGKAESAAAWRAMEAATLATPDEESEPLL